MLKFINGNAFVFIILSFIILPSYSSDVKIVAEFISRPGEGNVFTDVTPGASDSCSDARCPQGVRAIKIRNFGDIYFEDMYANASPRDSTYFSVPNYFQDVDVVNVDTGEKNKLKFRVNGFGARYYTKDDVTSITGESSNSTAHQALWQSGRWYGDNGACFGNGSAGGGYSRDYSFFWIWNQTAKISCHKTQAFDLVGQNFRIGGDSLSLAYEMKIDNPAFFKKGRYKGNVVYSVGPGGDFDFGDKAKYTRSSYEIEFELIVEHQFSVFFFEYRYLTCTGWRMGKMD